MQGRYAISVEFLLWLCQFTVIHVELNAPVGIPIIAMTTEWQRIISRPIWRRENMCKFIELHRFCAATFALITVSSSPTSLPKLIMAYINMPLTTMNAVSLIAFAVMIYYLCDETLEELYARCSAAEPFGAFTTILVAGILYINLTNLYQQSANIHLETLQMSSIWCWLCLLVLMIASIFTAVRQKQMKHAAQASFVCCVCIFISIAYHHVHPVWYLACRVLVHVQTRYIVFCIMAHIWNPRLAHLGIVLVVSSGDPADAAIFVFS